MISCHLLVFKTVIGTYLVKTRIKAPFAHIEIITVLRYLDVGNTSGSQVINTCIAYTVKTLAS